jgi:hypothetical protein
MIVGVGVRLASGVCRSSGWSSVCEWSMCSVFVRVVIVICFLVADRRWCGVMGLMARMVLVNADI